MLEDITQIIPIITWPGVAALFVWKVLAPLTNIFIKFLKSKNGNVDINIAERVEEIETNHLHDLKKDIDLIWNKLNTVGDTQIKIREDVAYLKARINGHR